MSPAEINRAIRRILWGPPRELPKPLREASHRLNNDVMALQAQVRRIRASPDPFWELAKAMRGDDNDEVRRG